MILSVANQGNSETVVTLPAGLDWSTPTGVNLTNLFQTVMKRTPREFEKIRVIVPSNVTITGRNGSSGLIIDNTWTSKGRLTIENHGKILGGGGLGGKGAILYATPPKNSITGIRYANLIRKDAGRGGNGGTAIVANRQVYVENYGIVAGGGGGGGGGAAYLMGFTDRNAKPRILTQTRDGPAMYEHGVGGSGGGGGAPYGTAHENFGTLRYIEKNPSTDARVNELAKHITQMFETNEQPHQYKQSPVRRVNTLRLFSTYSFVDDLASGVFNQSIDVMLNERFGTSYSHTDVKRLFAYINGLGLVTIAPGNVSGAFALRHPNGWVDNGDTLLYRPTSIFADPNVRPSRHRLPSKYGDRSRYELYVHGHYSDSNKVDPLFPRYDDIWIEFIPTDGTLADKGLGGSTTQFGFVSVPRHARSTIRITDNPSGVFAPPVVRETTRDQIGGGDGGAYGENGSPGYLNKIVYQILSNTPYQITMPLTSAEKFIEVLPGAAGGLAGKVFEGSVTIIDKGGQTKGRTA